MNDELNKQPLPETPEPDMEATPEADAPLEAGSPLEAPQPAAPAARKSRLPLVIGVVVVVLLLAAVGGFFALRSAESKALETGKLNLKAGDYAAAEASFTRAIEMQPGFVLVRQPEAVALRAETYYRSGQPEKALKDAETGLAAGENAALRLLRAHIYYDQGKLAEALEEGALVQELDDSAGFPYALQAYQHYRDYQFDPALTAAKAALDRDDSLALAYRVRGGVAAWRYEEKAAVADLEKALALEPNDVEAMAMLGFVHGTYARDAELTRMMERAQKASPDSPATLWLQAMHAYQSYDMDAVRELAGQAIAADPTRAEYYLFRAMSHSTVAQEKDTLADLDKGLSLAPELPALLSAKGIFLYNTAGEQDYEAVAAKIAAVAPKSIDSLELKALYVDVTEDYDALKVLGDQIIAAQPDFSTGYWVLGKAYLGQYHLALAEESIAAGLERNPRSINLLALRHDLHNKQGKPAEAIEDLKAALEINSDSAGLHALLSVAYLANDDPENARAELETARTLDAQSPAMFAAEAALALQEGDTDRAIDAANQAVAVHPNHPGPYLIRAGMYLADKNQTLAIADAKKVLELVPDKPQAYLLLGSVYGLQGKWDVVIESGKKALAQNPYAYEAYAMIGLAYGAKNNLVQVEENLQKSLEINPDQPALYLSLAKAQQELGEFEAAQKSLETYLKVGEDEPGEQLDNADASLRFLKTIPAVVDGKRAFRDSEAHFTITASEHWWPIESSLLSGVELVMYNAGLGGDNAMSIGVGGNSPETAISAGVTTQLVAQVFDQQYAGMFDGYQRISMEPFKGDYLDGYVLKFTFGDSSYSRTGWAYIFVQAPRYAVIEFFVDTKQAESIEIASAEIAETFNFLP